MIQDGSLLKSSLGWTSRLSPDSSCAQKCIMAPRAEEWDEETWLFCLWEKCGGRDWMMEEEWAISLVIQIPSGVVVQSSRTAAILPGRCLSCWHTSSIFVQISLKAAMLSLSFPRREIPQIAYCCPLHYLAIGLSVSTDESLRSGQIPSEANEHLPTEGFKRLGHWIVGNCVMIVTRGPISANCNGRFYDMDNCPLGTELG